MMRFFGSLCLRLLLVLPANERKGSELQLTPTVTYRMWFCDLLGELLGLVGTVVRTHPAF